MHVFSLIKYLSYMDWLRPLLTIVQNWHFGPSHTYRIPEQDGWSAAQIERLLRNKGIKTWGLDIVGSRIVLSTKLEQAGLAEGVLRSERIALENPADNSDRTQRSLNLDQQTHISRRNKLRREVISSMTSTTG